METINFQELSAEELMDTDGGINMLYLPLLAILIPDIA